MRLWHQELQTDEPGKSGSKQGLKDGWEEDANRMLFHRRPPIRTRGHPHQANQLKSTSSNFQSGGKFTCSLRVIAGAC